MEIATVDAVPLAAKLSSPFRFGRIERTVSSNVILRLTTDEGLVGYGEACPVPQLTSETQEGVVALIEQRIAPLLVGADPRRWRPLIEQARTRLHAAPFTMAAVDIALLDLAGKAHDLPVSALLGGACRERIPVHGSVGWDEQPERVADAAEAQAAQFEVLKLYAGRDALDADLARIAAARDRVGPAHPFLLDVNGLWSPLTALTAASRLRELDVVMAEQPVSPADSTGQAEVCAAYGTAHGIDVIADERVMAAHHVEAVARAGLARGINVGISKLGGVVAAFDTAMAARAVGLVVTLGSVVELGVATAAGVQLAGALPELAYPSYLMGPLKYERQITSPGIEIVDSALVVPDGPGLGIEVDEEALDALDRRGKATA